MGRYRNHVSVARAGQAFTPRQDSRPQTPKAMQAIKRILFEQAMYRQHRWPASAVHVKRCGLSVDHIRAEFLQDGSNPPRRTKPRNRLNRVLATRDRVHRIGRAAHTPFGFAPGSRQPYDVQVQIGPALHKGPDKYSQGRLDPTARFIKIVRKGGGHHGHAHDVTDSL